MFENFRGKAREAVLVSKDGAGRHGMSKQLLRSQKSSNVLMARRQVSENRRSLKYSRLYKGYLNYMLQAKTALRSLIKNSEPARGHINGNFNCKPALL